MAQDFLLSERESGKQRRQRLRRITAWVDVPIRALGAVALVFVVASSSLLLAQIAPGDYAAQLGEDPAVRAAERARLGLDRPVAEQYARSW